MLGDMRTEQHELARAAEAAVARDGRAEQGELHVGDPRFDDWEVVHDFEDLETARAWRQHLEEAGMEAVITVRLAARPLRPRRHRAARAARAAGARRRSS